MRLTYCRPGLAWQKRSLRKPTSSPLLFRPKQRLSGPQQKPPGQKRERRPPPDRRSGKDGTLRPKIPPGKPLPQKKKLARARASETPKRKQRLAAEHPLKLKSSAITPSQPNPLLRDPFFSTPPPRPLPFFPQIAIRRFPLMTLPPQNPERSGQKPAEAVGTRAGRLVPPPDERWPASPTPWAHPPTTRKRQKWPRSLLPQAPLTCRRQSSLTLLRPLLTSRTVH